MAVKVLVAEDHSIMRQGLVELLEGRDDMEVVGGIRAMAPRRLNLPAGLNPILW